MKPATLLPPVCALMIGALWLGWEHRTLAELDQRVERLKNVTTTDMPPRLSGREFQMPERNRSGYTTPAGKPDWKKVARKVASMPNASPNAFYKDIGLAVAMEKMLKAMSAREVSAAMDEVEAMDASEETKQAILAELADRLAGLDPQLMLDRFPSVSDSPHGGPYFMALTNALEALAAKDGAAATAWLDRMASEGNFRRRGLDGTNLVESSFEAALVSAGNAETATGLIAKMSPDQLEKIFGCWQFRISDANRQPLIDQIRSGGIPADKQSELLAEAVKGFRTGTSSLTEVGKFMEDSGASPTERIAMITSAFQLNLYNLDYAPKNLDEVRAWATKEAPDDVERITGQALGNLAQYGNFRKRLRYYYSCRRKAAVRARRWQRFWAAPQPFKMPMRLWCCWTKSRTRRRGSSSGRSYSRQRPGNSDPTMKFSLLISAGILLLAGLFGKPGYDRIRETRESVKKLEQQARAAGYDPENLPIQATRTSKPDREAEGRNLAAKLIAAIKIDELGKDRGLELMSEMCALDVAGFKALLAAVKSSGDLSDEDRTTLMEMTMVAISSNSPQLALGLWEADPASFPQREFGQLVLETAIEHLAQDDPARALAWVRRNSGRFGEFLTSTAKNALIQGLAPNDPALAFSLIGELKIDEPTIVGRIIARSATTPEAQTQVLAALRSELSQAGATGQAAKETLLSLGKNALADDPAHGGAWLDAQLSKDEAQFVAREFKPLKAGVDAGPLLAWMGDKLPPAEAQQKAGEILKRWANTDYAAVANWLDSTPDGTSRQNAILAFAGPAAVYQPEAAEGWAASLPEGHQKQELLDTIYKAWSKKDPTAAKVFARQHGIQQ